MSKDQSEYLIKRNNKQYEVVIGLEVHAQVLSKSKLFSTSATKFGAEPNTQVSLVDAAFPGMLPVINEFCVKQAIKTGIGLNAKINNTPAISILISRLKNCCELDDVVVATSNSPLDDELAEYLKKTNTLFFRGSENDVLQRVVDTAGYFDAETIVEINGDCILTDFNVVDSAVQIFNKGNYDVVTNCGENLSYPHGNICSSFLAKITIVCCKKYF